MAKSRFRKVKQGKIDEAMVHSHGESGKKTKKGHDGNTTVSAGMRIKAFITDSFMLLMPIMYIVFYLVMGGREGFAHHKAVGWLYIVVPYIVVTSIFLIRSGQTPGMKAYGFRLDDNSGEERVSKGRVVVRQILAIVDFLLFGWLLMFFRKDHRTPHEIVTGTTFVPSE